MTIDPFTACGILGAGCFIVAYFANVQGWLVSSGRGYPATNLAGAVLVLVSLYAEWNLPSVVLECFWAVISLYGVLRHGLRR